MRSSRLARLTGSNGWLWAVFVLAIVARVTYAAVIYTPDFSAFETGDYALYRIGADHIMTNGDFSNSLFLVRPPLFPVWIAVLGNNPALVVIGNILFGALTASLGMVFAWSLGLSRRAGQFVGVFLAIEPTTVIYSAFLGPEPLANLFLLAALIALVKAVRAEYGIGWSVGAGLALVASMYVRPASYLFWIPVAIGWLIYDRRWRQTWQRVAGFVVVSAVGVGAWTAHNAIVFATPSFSSIGPYTMVYYRAASVERIATGQPIDAVYVSINERVAEYAGLQLDHIDEGTRHGFLAAPPNVQAALNRVAGEIFRANPLITLATFPIGFARMYGLFPDEWMVFTVGLVIFNGVFTLGAVIGVVMAVKEKRWFLLGMTLLPVLYYTAGTLIVKSAGMDTRERSMLEPMLAILFTLTVTAVWKRVKGRGDKRVDAG